MDDLIAAQRSKNDHKFRFSSNSTVTVLLFLTITIFPIVFGLSNYRSQGNLLSGTTSIIHNEPWDKYSSSFEKLFNDNFPFKNGLIHLSAFLRYRLLDTSANAKVLVGKNGWLFSADTNDGDPMADYHGNNLFSQTQLQQIKENLEEQNEWLKARGESLVVMVPPNSQSIYEEFLPPNVKRFKQETRLSQISAFLKANSNLKFVDATHQLLEKKQTGTLYFTTDHRWNELGAFWGYQELMQQLYVISPKLQPKKLSDFDISTKESNGGDLAKALGLEDIIREVQPQLIPHFKTQSKDVKANIQHAIVTEVDNQELPKAVMFTDSYSDLLKPYLSEHFQRIVYKRDFDFDIELIKAEKPDIVIYEISEKYLDTLLSGNPDEVAKTVISSNATTSNSDNHPTLGVKPEAPIITAKTLLGPTLATLVGTAQPDSTIIVAGGASVATTKAVNGYFVVSVDLKPNVINNLVLTVSNVEHACSDPVSVTLSPDNSAPTKPVVIGKNGWLFLADTISDYQGTNLFTQVQLERIKKNLEGKRDWLLERNCAFVLTIAPNALTIYPEYAPDSLKRAEQTRLSQLTNYLRNNSDVQFVELRDQLISKKNQGALYYQTDSHWNELGAFWAYQGLMYKLNIFLPNLQAIPIESYMTSNSKHNGGDLVYYLGVKDSLLKEQNCTRFSPCFTPGSNLIPDSPMAWIGQTNQSFVTEVKQPNLPKAIVFRDSYATNLMPFLSEHFRRLVYNEEWDFTLNTELVNREKPDVVIYEYVENNLGLLLDDNNSAKKN